MLVKSYTASLDCHITISRSSGVMAAIVSTPTSVTQLHPAALRQVADTTTITIRELLAKSTEELLSLCRNFNIQLPADAPKREELFYTLVAKLFGRDSLSEDRQQATEGDVLPHSISLDSQLSVSEHDMRILESVEFSRKVDDGSNRDMWRDADLILLGVSRSGKTPLSMFLASKGYKVANNPLVQGLPIPDELYQFDQSRVVALVLDPDVLVAIRKKRAAQMGLNERSAAYVDVERIEEELQWVKNLYRQHPQWTMLDVTFRGIEETAAKILKVMSQKHPDRFGPPEYN